MDGDSLLAVVPAVTVALDICPRTPKAMGLCQGFTHRFSAVHNSETPVPLLDLIMHNHRWKTGQLRPPFLHVRELSWAPRPTVTVRRWPPGLAAPQWFLPGKGTVRLSCIRLEESSAFVSGCSGSEGAPCGKPDRLRSHNCAGVAAAFLGGRGPRWLLVAGVGQSVRGLEAWCRLTVS